MKRCESCNYQCEDYAKICPRCGRPLAKGAYVGPSQQPGKSVRPGNMPHQERQAGQGYAPIPDMGGQRQKPMQYGYITPYDHTMEFTSEEIVKGKPFAMINYLLGVSGILICLISRENEFVKFHVKENVKYMIINALASLFLGGAGLLFLLLSLSSAGDITYMLSYGYGQSSNLMSIASFFFILLIIVNILTKILQFVCFVRVGMGKAVEAPIVCHFNFMK